jgi:hypothetical protein
VSKATYLAGLYEAEMWPGDMTLRKWGKATVEELRRIDAINAELLAALKETLEEGIGWYDECRGDGAEELDWVIRARAAIPSTKGSNIELDTADELRDIAKNFGDALREEAEKLLKEQT